MENRVASSRVLIALIIVGSVFLLMAGAAIAAGSASHSSSQDVKIASGANGVSGLPVTNSVSGTQHMTGGQMIAGCIATLFDVPISHVVTLRSDGYGFGEIAKAYFLARDSGFTVAEILDLRELDDMGWGEIAKSYGLPPSNRDRNLGQIISGRATVSGTVPIAAQRLAERLDATSDEVAALLDQGASYGTIIVAYKLAGKIDGAIPAKLVEQRLLGLSWGQIKRDATTAGTSTESGQGKPEHAGQPDDAGPPEHAGPKDPKDHSGPPPHAGPKDKKK